MKNLLLELDLAARAKLVAKQNKRLTSSAKFYESYFEKWKIYYKVYHSLKDEAADTDEPNILVPLAYGIVEDAVARLAIPILQKLPIAVKAKAMKYAENAEKFYNACKDYFGGCDFRLDRISSEREYVITGNAWEIYSWKNDVLRGKQWKDVESPTEVEYEVSFMGKMVQKMKTMLGINAPKEVEKDFPEQIGFDTRFPSIFSMFPEPGVKKFKNMSWVIEAEGVVSLADLKKATYIDPDTRESKPLYDLTELMKAYEGKEEKIRPECSSMPTGEDISQIISGNAATKDSDSDEPAVFITRTFQRDNTILTVAQGKFLIHAITEVYHYPVMPIQLRVYTQDKENLFGSGIIQPILELLYEVNDIHNMAFQNWIRTINKMVVYDESVIKYPDDFTPRAGGKIRANLLAGGNVNHAFGTVDHQDVSASMINMESQSMGKIEKAISISDLTPGAMGTKAYHKTYGGLMEIQSSFARRFEIMSMTGLAYMTRQMQIMYWMFQQFMFDDMPMGVFKDGVFRAETYRREDFDSGGQGFLFVQATDPSFGDAAVQRNQLMVLFDQGLKYENNRMMSKDPELKRVALDVIYKLVLSSFGVQDTTQILAMPNGIITPQQEFDMMLQGMPPVVNPRENFIEHMIAHVQQRNRPEFMDAVSAGKFPPEVMGILDAHIAETQEMIKLYMENIDEIAMAKQAEEASKDPEYASNSGMGGNMGGMPQSGEGGGLGSQSVNANVVAGANNGSGMQEQAEE